MSDLPKELVEEILSKIPVTCMRSVRLTCKKWNALSKTRSFVEKHIGEETSRKSSVIMTMNQKVYLLGVSFKTRNKKFFICFDFTEERLGSRLSFPFDSYFEDIVILSNFGEEQIAVLFKKWGKFEMKIWVTSKINPTTVSWSKFLEVDMRPFITGCNHVFTQSRGFFIDEEKKVVVVFGRHEFDDTRKIAYIIGEDGYFRKVDLGEDTNIFSHQHVRSYVPSSVHINHPFC
ncbi:BnaA02g25410D [Brassica napus]|uniref:BnaA02g25410D protein n=1 Tax=Brassica napus TaxID=3708 RepID=A0A078GQW5_BRANA|nr:BnaA02g25410D [Brassica napus]